MLLHRGGAHVGYGILVNPPTGNALTITLDTVAPLPAPTSASGETEATHEHGGPWRRSVQQDSTMASGPGRRVHPPPGGPLPIISNTLSHRDRDRSARLRRSPHPTCLLPRFARLVFPPTLAASTGPRSTTSTRGGRP